MSESFYHHHARRYSEVSHAFRQSVYTDASHPGLNNDWDLLERAKSLAPGKRCLDAGCGAGARDVHALWQAGYDVYGIDAVPENIEVAREMHAEIADRVAVADLRQPLPFDDLSFDLVLCNAVIQHIAHEDVMAVTLPELVRVLRPAGILQLMFKNGDGVLSLYDADYAAQRSFLLYDEDALLVALAGHGMKLVSPDPEGGLGGVMYFTDPKGARHCVFHMRKRS
ncbi:MAG: class I SAM-dependent methyltransferase [Chloroflexi bacterium]|nr:class I SAM-dependent methyltransferase [Chloroflexota bacterium]